MDSPRNIKIPGHWLIDTGVTTYWPHKEGIWVNNQTAPFLRLVCVYHGLMDIPEAQDQLTRCNKQFIDENAGVLLHFFDPIVQKAKGGEKLNEIGSPFQSDADEEKASSIYRTWVDSWALGSDKMLEWVIGFNVITTILNLLGLNHQDRQRLHNRIADLGSNLSLSWVWQTLLSGDYRRLDQTKRALARHTAQSKEFYRLRERTFWTHAYYWIMVRILEIQPSKLLNELAANSSKKDFRLTENDLTDKILKTFDDALEYNRVPGRPLSVKESSVGVKMR